jgi:glycosyltransferase involved in cell wall biosynthesis
VHATIVGGFEIDDAQARLRQQAADLGVGDRVHFPGVVDDTALKGHYQRSHLYVMPSRSDRHKVEGFGLVYLEAGAFGRPQIGCLDTGAEEPIVDGETGFLVPQNDPEALADAIARLHGDRLLLERMGAAARARACAMSWDATVEGILAEYPWRQVSRGFDSRIMRMRRW